MLWETLKVAIISILSGTLVGLSLVLIFKHLRFLVDQHLIVCAISFFFAYFALSLANTFEGSGVIAAFTTGFILGIYGPHNIP